jgi:hypothetical protein
MKPTKLVLKKIAAVSLSKLPLVLGDLSSVAFDFWEGNVFYAIGHSQEEIADRKGSEETDTLKIRKTKRVKPLRCEKITILDNGELLTSTVAFLALSKTGTEDVHYQMLSYSFSQSHDLLLVMTESQSVFVYNFSSLLANDAAFQEAQKQQAFEAIKSGTASNSGVNSEVLAGALLGRPIAQRVAIGENIYDACWVFNDAFISLTTS